MVRYNIEKKVINLNKLKNYKSIAYATPLAQLNKVKEEYHELLDEVEVKSLTYSFIKNINNFKAEALDLITATVNLLLLSGLTEQDFEKHINKLEYYKNVKYKR
nr:MAG TPA: triphosphate pyrophosphohydrolase [Caudoviricetes sp.]